MFEARVCKWVGWMVCVVGLSFMAVGAHAQTRPEHTFARGDGARQSDTPWTLSADQLGRGFGAVGTSVKQCMERQLKRKGEFSMDSVRVTVLIQRNGRVSHVRLGKEWRGSAFGKCMKAHSKRWRFDAFTGRSIRVSKMFRMEVDAFGS